jgi:hypothetical protein
LPAPENASWICSAWILHAGLTPDEWSEVRLAFEKRHLLAHKMRVIDQEYLDATGEPSAQAGQVLCPLPQPRSPNSWANFGDLGAGLYDQLAKIP